MRWIYLSPHLDDAALCAGGLIFDQTRRGLPVEIWTFMSGMPEAEKLSDFAREMHAKWGTTGAREAVELRREEDRSAAAVLGAEPVHLDFTDALYRWGVDGAALYADPVRAPRHTADAALPAQLVQAMRIRLQADDAIVCLLGIGEHVDHVLVREAAEMLGMPLRFVADLPYALTHPEAVDKKARGLQPAVYPVSAAGLDAWIESIGVYRSQLSSLYVSWELLQEAIRKRCQRDGGIRVWSAPLPFGLDSGPNP